jgi:GTP-binding protein
MDTILEVVPAPIVREGTPQLQITSLDYSNYTGRIAIGRLHRGGLKENMPVSLVKRDGKVEKTRVK